MSFSPRERWRILPRPSGSGDRGHRHHHRLAGGEELCGLQQRAQCAEPGSVGVHHDRRPLLRQWEVLGWGPVLAPRLVRGEFTAKSLCTSPMLCLLPRDESKPYIFGKMLLCLIIFTPPSSSPFTGMFWRSSSHFILLHKHLLKSNFNKLIDLLCWSLAIYLILSALNIISYFIFLITARKYLHSGLSGDKTHIQRGQMTCY